MACACSLELGIVKTEIVRALLVAKADPFSVHCDDSNRIPVHSLAEMGDVEAFKLFLGFDQIDRKSTEGLTVSQSAERSGHSEICRLLE